MHRTKSVSIRFCSSLAKCVVLTFWTCTLLENTSMYCMSWFVLAFSAGQTWDKESYFIVHPVRGQLLPWYMFPKSVPMLLTVLLPFFLHFNIFCYLQNQGWCSKHPINSAPKSSINPTSK